MILVSTELRCPKGHRHILNHDGSEYVSYKGTKVHLITYINSIWYFEVRGCMA